MREHIWRMSKSTYEYYLNILGLIQYTQPETDEFEALKDELQSLPGHPKDMQFGDFVRVEITSVQH